MRNVARESTQLRTLWAISTVYCSIFLWSAAITAFMTITNPNLRTAHAMQDLLTLYKNASFIRAFEQEIACAADAGHAPGLLHLCSGAELVEAAICGILSGPVDQVCGSHRSHGLAIAMGADPVGVAAEILGRTGGMSAGRGGTQHLLAPEQGFLTSNGIVGGQLPIAAGAALSAKTRDTGGIAAVFFGDGAANQGAVFETMNLAVALQLPLLFVLENNGLGQSTSVAFSSGNVDLLARAEGFGLAVMRMDGFSATNCLEIAQQGIDRVRSSGAPVFIEASTARLSGHYHGEDAPYLSQGATPADPIEVLARLLPGEARHAIAAATDRQAKAAIAAALDMPEIQHVPEILS